jgi:hypothetical protein
VTALHIVAAIGRKIPGDVAPGTTIGDPVDLQHGGISTRWSRMRTGRPTKPPARRRAVTLWVRVTPAEAMTRIVWRGASGGRSARSCVTGFAAAVPPSTDPPAADATLYQL